MTVAITAVFALLRSINPGGIPTVANKPNYNFEKRKKELEKKQKQEEKRRRKRENAENAAEGTAEGAIEETDTPSFASDAPTTPATPPE